MSAGFSAASQRWTASISGSSGLLLSVAVEAAAVVASFPFDPVFVGMVAAGQGIQAICVYLGLTRAALDHHLARLGLRPPHDRPLRKPGSRGWSELDTRRLIAWRVRGIHPETIGERLGRSANAVRAKARRLGVPRPDRKSLQRVDPASLEDPAPEFAGAHIASSKTSLKAPSAVCGTAAGPIGVQGFGSARDAAGSSSPVQGSEESTPSCHSETVRRAEDRREPPLFGVVSGSHRGGMPARESRPAAPPESAAASWKPDRANRNSGVGRPTPQPELPLFPAIEPLAPHGTLAREPAGPVAPAQSRPAVRRPGQPIPQKKEGVCLSGDLTWIGTMKTRARNPVAVWVVGMLRFGGLDRWAIAERTGMTPGAVRTLLTRVGVPVDHDRGKFGAVFDEECARETEKRSGFEVVVEKGVDESRKEYFWCHKKDRAAVTRNRKYRLATGRLERYQSEVVNIITRRDLDAERGVSRMPFAENPATVAA